MKSNEHSLWVICCPGFCDDATCDRNAHAVAADDLCQLGTCDPAALNDSHEGLPRQKEDFDVGESKATHRANQTRVLWAV